MGKNNAVASSCSFISESSSRRAPGVSRKEQGDLRLSQGSAALVWEWLDQLAVTQKPKFLEQAFLIKPQTGGPENSETFITKPRVLNECSGWDSQHFRASCIGLVQLLRVVRGFRGSEGHELQG